MLIEYICFPLLLWSKVTSSILIYSAAMLAGLFYRQNGVSAHRSEVLTENRYARFSDSKESNCSGGSSLSSPNCNTQGRYGMRGSPAFPRKCGTGELRETSLLCDHDEPALPASRKFSGAVSCSTFSSNAMGYLLEKLKAALKGCSVRRRMKTPTYQLLKGRIKKTSCGNSSGVNDRYTISQRKHNVSQLISFLEGNLEALVVSKDTDVDVEKPVAGRCENANGGSDKCTQFHESSKIHPGVHLSNEAKVNTDFIRFSLMETIGDSNFSLESMSNKLDASFLDMRRRDFLQKIFIIETRRPPGTKSSNGIGLHNFCPLGFSQALTSHGVGYRRIIQHLERIAGE
uniref:Uncharacterized protein TCIL3000_11_8510 n=1 Tax=Trypanosoma congolense (strain IL3000) TaxID=1068625 RepID=G0V176_TRYCI|nr:unnamed protein product [Trypanosoma congolense IL3000]